MNNNNNKNEIKSIMTDIHRDLNSFIENEISLDEANGLYQNYQIRFDLIKKNINADRFNFIQEILYSHNINNFSKLSFIYKKTTSDMALDQSAGDSSLINNLFDIIRQPDTEFAERELADGDKKYGKVFTISFIHKNYSIVFGAVSASKLFDRSKFLIIADIINRIYEKQASVSNPYFIDYYNIRSENAAEYILNKLMNGFELIAHVYVFKKIYEIYSHSGRKNLESLYAYILETIQNNYSDASIHILSGGFFIVLLNKSDQTAAKMPKIEFTYNNFPIIYNKIKLEILNETEIYKFWEDLYNFRHYASQGDQ